MTNTENMCEPPCWERECTLFIIFMAFLFPPRTQSEKSHVRKERFPRVDGQL